MPRFIIAIAVFTLVLQSTFAGSVTYQFYRFTPTKLRNGAAANSVQMSELQFFLGAMQRTGAMVSNQGGNNPGNEGPANLSDNNTGSKWLDFNVNPVVFNYGGPVEVDSYRWATANDAAERDPIRWTLEGSSNGTSWTLLDDRTSADQAVSTDRNAMAPASDLNQVPDTPVINFDVTTEGGVTSDTAVGILSGQSTTLNWQVEGADTVTLSGELTGASGNLVVSPTATTAYELTATNSFGTESAMITVYLGNSISPPVINELAAVQSRDGVLCDEDGDPSDWIELYNPNPFAIDAGGFYLTDNSSLLTRWQIPDGSVMEPEGYLVIFASGKDRAGAEKHSSFSLASGGEYLAILADDGVTVLEEFSPSYPVQDEDVSYGRTANGFDYFTGPTPGAINDTPAGALGPKVVFEIPAGTFLNSMIVTLSTLSPSAEIRYTTDGSLPTEAGLLYSGPISLTNSALVRARAFQAGFTPGKVKGEAYLRISGTAANQTSDLPIVVIDNFGAGAIPNNIDLQPSYFSLFEPDPVTGRTNLTSLPTKANRAGIKRRGSSTLNDPKGNYRIEFWQDDSEEDRSLNLLGMSDHDEWVLFAPYNFDRSLMRIPFLHSLSNDMGTYAPRTKFVELYLNTGGSPASLDYQGVYVLQERISRGNDRIDVERLDKNDTFGESVTGGYILSIDRLDSTDQGFRSSLGHPFDPPNGSPQPWFTYVYPKEQNLLPEQETYIRGYIDDFESALYGGNFKDSGLGYEPWFDVDASIDHHILTTFSKDPDGLRLSSYLFKPRGGKLGFGPIWDFDRTMGSDSDGRSADPTGWNPTPERAEFFEYDYWGRLFQDENFMQAWIDRWQELRRGEFANAALSARLDGMAVEIAESQPRNAARWPEVAPNGGPLTGLGGWAGEVDHLKNWVTMRADWIDGQFVAPPILQSSAIVQSGEAVTGSAVEGTLYYTIDGLDPRLPGGGIRPSAIAIASGGGSAMTLVSEATSQVQVLKPNSATPGVAAWTLPGFDPVGWLSGSFGVGYDYPSLNLDVSGVEGPHPTSVYVRVPFQVANVADLVGLTLRVKYDDGFVAYLNGVKIGSQNAPDPLVWNAAATQEHFDAEAVVFEDFDVSAYLSELIEGDNVLAIHALNTGTANADNTGSGSSDMLVSAELLGEAVSGGITINGSSTMTARAYLAGEWSGPVQSTFVVGVPASAANLVVSEIMYHPTAPTEAEMTAGFLDESDFEYLELQNVSGDSIVVSGATFSGVFDLPVIDVTIPSGGVVLIIRNTQAFELRYGGGLPVVAMYGDTGEIDGGQKLSNGGETLTLTSLSGNLIQNFSYDDDGLLGWPVEPDGQGASLVLKSPLTLPDHGLASSWRASLAQNGTPGIPNDSLYLEWVSLNFEPAEFINLLISGPNADPDRDGLENLLELALGTNPKSADFDPLPRVGIATLSDGVPIGGDYSTFTFRRAKGLPDINIRVRFSEDLDNWDQEGALVSATDHGDGTETLVFRDLLPISQDSPKKFVRVEVILN